MLSLMTWVNGFKIETIYFTNYMGKEKERILGNLYWLMRKISIIKSSGAQLEAWGA